MTKGNTTTKLDIRGMTRFKDHGTRSPRMKQLMYKAIKISEWRQRGLT